MNFYKQVLLRCPDDEFQDVNVFVLCLSLLDKDNLPETNLATLRSIFYRARKLLPNAQFYVSLFGAPENSTHRSHVNVQNLNDLIKSRTPAGCTVIPPPENFVASEYSLSSGTKEAIFETLSYFL